MVKGGAGGRAGNPRRTQRRLGAATPPLLVHVHPLSPPCCRPAGSECGSPGAPCLPDAKVGVMRCKHSPGVIQPGAAHASRREPLRHKRHRLRPSREPPAPSQHAPAPLSSSMPSASASSTRYSSSISRLDMGRPPATVPRTSAANSPLDIVAVGAERRCALAAAITSPRSCRWCISRSLRSGGGMGGNGCTRLQGGKATCSHRAAATSVQPHRRESMSRMRRA